MKPRPNPQGRNRLEEGLKRLGFLKQQGVNPFHDLNATMAEGDGFELPDLTHQHLDRAALLSSLKPYEPEPVPPGLSIPCGVDVNTGKAVHLNVETMDNVILAGATKTGKNNGACHLLAGWLRLGKRGEVIAQKGDEFEMATRFPGAVYLPLDLEPWNDWTVIGPDRHAFWTANAEAIAIPTGLKEQTFPEIPIIAEQMYRSDPHFPWIALVKTLQWKARQPGGREKHETAAGCLATYAAAIGDRAYVERGIDIRERYPLIVWGYHKYDLLQAEVALGLRFVREKFDALRRGHSRQPVRVLFIPEGQLLFSREIEALRRGNFSYLSRFFTMANSLGIRIWIACQSVTRISSYVLNNCPTLLVYRQDELRSAEICAESLGLTPEVAPELMLLPPGVCYVKTPGWDRPCKVRMEQVVPDTHPTEANIRNHFKDEYDRLRAQATYAQPDNHVASIDWRSIVDGGASVGRAASKTPVPLLHDHYLLLREILANPTAGLKTHYDQVGGWGIPRGNRTLAELRRVGAVTVRKEKTANPKGGGGRLIASVTPLGRTLLAAFERQNSKS